MRENSNSYREVRPFATDRKQSEKECAPKLSTISPALIGYHRNPERYPPKIPSTTRDPSPDPTMMKAAKEPAITESRKIFHWRW